MHSTTRKYSNLNITLLTITTLRFLTYKFLLDFKFKNVVMMFEFFITAALGYHLLAVPKSENRPDPFLGKQPVSDIESCEGDTLTEQTSDESSVIISHSIETVDTEAMNDATVQDLQAKIEELKLKIDSKDEFIDILTERLSHNENMSRQLLKDYEDVLDKSRLIVNNYKVTVKKNQKLKKINSQNMQKINQLYEKISVLKGFCKNSDSDFNYRMNDVMSLMSNLSKIKNENQQMADKLNSITLENSRLRSKINKISSATPPGSSRGNSPRSFSLSSKKFRNISLTSISSYNCNNNTNDTQRHIRSVSYPGPFFPILNTNINNTQIESRKRSRHISAGSISSIESFGLPRSETCEKLHQVSEF